MIYRFLKRILDFVFALLLLILLSPLLICVAIMIKVDSKGLVFFKQDRLGLHGRVFKIYKFRSMVMNAEKIGSGVYSYEKDPRVTKIGKLIRKTSIDELPQLFNIIKGDMSFIGPRPTLVYHPWLFSNYTIEQKKRFSVLPGVTGLAQVNGRKKIQWPERIVLDVKYVNNMSLFFDVKILFKTVFKVFSMQDVFNVYKLELFDH